MGPNVEKLQRDIQQLQQSVRSLEGLLQHHKHDGLDGSGKLLTSIDLKDGQAFTIGNAGGITAGQDSTQLRTVLGLISGIDQNTSDGSQNAQVVLDHYASTVQSFFYASRKPIYGLSNTINIVSGTSIATQSQYTFPINQLTSDASVKTYLVVNTADLSSFNIFPILSNTTTQITVDGSWSFTGTNLSGFIYVPVYLGSADYPWQRAYVTDGTAGGVRFGIGPTNAGQNSLLYMASDGTPHWRDTAGVDHQLRYA